MGWQCPAANAFRASGWGGLAEVADGPRASAGRDGAPASSRLWAAGAPTLPSWVRAGVSGLSCVLGEPEPAAPEDGRTPAKQAPCHLSDGMVNKCEDCFEIPVDLAVGFCKKDTR